MKLARHKPATTQRRQPKLATSTDRQPMRSSHYSSRVDSQANLGRQQSRKTANLAPDRLLNYWLQRFGLLVLLVVCMVSAVSALSLNSDARIITLKSSGSGFLRDQSVYQKTVSGLLRQSVWNRNKLTIDTANISQQMLTKYPELSSVTVVLPMLAHRPVVYLTPSQPALIIAGANGTFILDVSGKALLAVADIKTAANLKLPVLTDQSGLKLVLGQRVLSSTDISFVQVVIAQLAAKQVAVSSLTLPVASREIDAAITGQPFVVKFNLQDGKALQQAGTFLAVIGRLTSQNITPARYVDVRVPGRAYYQ